MYKQGGCLILIGHTVLMLHVETVATWMQVAPAHCSIELGIGDAILIKALAQATGRQEAQVKKEYASVGDLGEVACNSKGKQRTMFPTKPLTIEVVLQFCKAARL